MNLFRNMIKGSEHRRWSVALSVGLLFGAGVSLAQGFYDDDLYFDPSKAKKEKTEQKAKKQQSNRAKSDDTNHLYYYDGVNYVPWDNVNTGVYPPASDFVATGGSQRDVDEYNRRGAYAQTPDSISLQQFEDISADMPATRELARFGGSSVAQSALEDEGYDLSFNNGYNEGYAAGYDQGTQSNSSVVLSFGTGYYPSWLYPYGYGGLYDTWGWPYNGWRYTYYNPYYYGWTPMWAWNWGWSWGWTSPSWGWGGWHHPGPGWGPGSNYYPTSPIAAHRPRVGSGSVNNGSSNRNGHYGTSASGGNHYGSSSRPGYNPPIDGRTNSSGNRTGIGYGGSTSGRNSHYGGSTSGSSHSSGYRSGSSSSSSSRGSSYNSGSSSSSRGSSSSSGRSGGSFGGGSRSGGGGGGHRSR